MNVLIDFSDLWQSRVIGNAVEAALKYENFKENASLEAIIVTKDEIQSLNKQTRNIDKVTDVLSFPNFDSVDDMITDETGSVFLGSMVICKDRAYEQAEEYGHSIEREVAFLAVHSTLHLLGYDHELGKEQEKEMFEKQEKILESIGLTR